MMSTCGVQVVAQSDMHYENLLVISYMSVLYHYVSLYTLILGSGEYLGRSSPGLQHRRAESGLMSIL